MDWRSAVIKGMALCTVVLYLYALYRTLSWIVAE